MECCGGWWQPVQQSLDAHIHKDPSFSSLLDSHVLDVTQRPGTMWKSVAWMDAFFTTGYKSVMKVSFVTRILLQMVCCPGTQITDDCLNSD